MRDGIEGREVAYMSAVEVTNADFQEEVLNSDQLVLVDFWASWCGPCKILSPLIDEIVGERPDIKVCKVNVEDESELAERYGVMSIPTLIVFKNGEAVKGSVGVIPKQDILDMLQ